ncbi:MAG TPA: ABC transporter permease [Actinomycetota bacterium]|nr:ABC transporter permease [Actinomycetota bacterium]
MNDVRQGWLVAVREMRERSRTRGFRAGFVVTILIVVAVIVVPAVLGSGGGTNDVGLAGSVPDGLPIAIRAQSDAAGMEAAIHRYESVGAGEEAARQGDVDVLVVDARRLEWPRQTDEQLRAVVAGAIQLVAVRERVAAAGISPDDLLAVVEPVRVENVELGALPGGSPDDEMAAMLMTVMLLIAISTYGNMVLTGVVEERASRVVEVLLVRMPARTLLAGKVVGIGLLGLAQFVVTALVAFAVISAVDAVDVPAVRGIVLAWVVAWFLLGYALYAMAYGALGSLASQTEDGQSVAGPVIAVLIAAYWVSFAALGQDPQSGASQLVSLFPATAPFAMPARIAMGASTWWEAMLAVILTVAAVAGLVRFGGRVYAGAILHAGPTLKMRDAWRGAMSPHGGGTGPMFIPRA